MKHERRGIAQANMARYLAGFSIECVEFAAACDPKCPLTVFVGEVYFITAETRRVVWIMCIPNRMSVGWIKHEQSLEGCQP